MPLIRTLAILMLCWLSAAAQAQSIEPAPDWKTADSAHFRVNYREPWRAQAERVAQVAERVYPRITQSMGWEPRGRTEIVLIDQFDLANGYSTPVPFNAIGVFLAPPDEGELLDNSDWLELLLAHEFVHTVQLDKVRGVPGVLQSIFGRQPLFFPNIFQPSWAIEGLATLTEGDAASGRGRLHGPVFEAWLRAEAERGFLTLREINADGRALPMSKSYLYGAYFFEFLARRYGMDAVYKGVDHYSGNPPFWPRLHTNPQGATGKTMDVLWDEFLADLKQQVAQRAQPLTRVPEAVGERLGETLFGVGGVAALADGAVLAVLDDGLHHAKLVKVMPNGERTELANVNRAARLDVSPEGKVLVTQPDICNWRYLAYDLYRLDDNGRLRQLTHCARVRQAVQAGNRIVGLQQSQGNTRLVVADAEGQNLSVLWAPGPEVNLIDLAATRDGRQVAVASKQRGHWRVELFDLDTAQPAPKLLFTHDAPVHGLVYGAQGLEFIAVRNGVYNVWRLDGSEWVKLTHTHTRVTAHGGTQADGSLALAVVAPGGYQLRRMAASGPLVRLASSAQDKPAAPAAAADAAGTLGAPSSYQAWRSMYPRAWLPAISSDRGLAAFGASTFGADALGWHQYAASLQVEATQGDWMGTLQYMYRDQHIITFQRQLTPRAWENGDEEEDVTAYDRETSAQWLSLVPWQRLDRSIIFGVGAATEHTQRVNAERVASGLPRRERMLAALFEYDSTTSNWWSEGRNRGQHATVLYESYRPFAREGRNDFDGGVTRLDWRGFVPVGRSVLALRHTEARAHGRTERFQLGGAVDAQLQYGYALNNRDITLRGYRGDERSLVGANARVTSIEWRTPIADIDRHFMVPAVGVNRLSAAAFFDIGGAWDDGNRPLRYRRGVGVEMLAELKALYAMSLQLRLGLAHGLDEPSGTRGYLAIGRGF